MLPRKSSKRSTTAKKMWRSFTTGFRSATGTVVEQSAGENENRNNIFDDDGDVEEEEESKVEYSEAQLLPCESEKKHILQMFYTMRKDSFFCDVAFVCNGVLFRAHRVVVSSWSRWLRALLCESPDEEVVSLDFFDPSAFGAALDYMYGVPLTITVEVNYHKFPFLHNIGVIGVLRCYYVLPILRTLTTFSK